LSSPGPTLVFNTVDGPVDAFHCFDAVPSIDDHGDVVLLPSTSENGFAVRAQ
jgi:hypothetical protein